MNQFSLEQLAAALSALGISVSNMDVAVGPTSHAHASVDTVAGPLLTFHCSHCAFPNAVSFSAVPTMMGIPLPSSRSGGRLVPRVSELTHAPIVPATVTPAPVVHAPIAPAPIVHAPVAIAPAPIPAVAPAPAHAPIVAPTAPAPGPSQPASIAVTVGPDGPWYVVSKERSVGIYRGWQNVSSLVTGVGRACFFRCNTCAAAQVVFDEALAAGAMEIL